MLSLSFSPVRHLDGRNWRACAYSGVRAAEKWLGQANGGFLDNSAVASQPLDPSLKIDGVCDFNRDGKADVLIQWSDGSLQTWVGSDTGAILSQTEEVPRCVSNPRPPRR